AERMGRDDRRGRRPDGDRRVVAVSVSRPRHHADGSRLQPCRRRPARPARPAHARRAVSLVEIIDLTVDFATDEGVVSAVDAASLEIRASEILGLVGESGSGKSVTSLAILRLIRPPGRIVRGTIRFNGVDLLALPEEE